MGVGEVCALVVAGLLILVLCRVFFKPLKGLFALLLQTLLGGLGLYIFNFLMAKTGFFIGMNLATAAICGVLGLPGFFLLVAGRILFLL